jgi:hypothetical protein
MPTQRPASRYPGWQMAEKVAASDGSAAGGVCPSLEPGLAAYGRRPHVCLGA